LFARHVGKNARGGFDITSRALFIRRGDSGTAVTERQSTENYLIELVTGTDDDLIMPAQGQRLADNQIGILRAWIDQGLKWGPRDPAVIEDLHATIYHALGICPKLAYELENRPFYVTRDGEGKSIQSLFA